jgi:hypothetical protein
MADTATGASAVTNALLETYDGQNILDICGRCFDQYGYKEKAQAWKWVANHCAHFVAHVLSIQIGTTCWVANGGRRSSSSASIRVNEIFNNCPNQAVVELVEAEPSQAVAPAAAASPKRAKKATQPNYELQLPAGPCLVYVTRKKNINLDTMKMGDHQEKHIGILVGKDVWQYSNGDKGPKGKVKRISAEAFSRMYDRSRKKTVTLASGFPAIVPMPFAVLERACKRDPLPTEPPQPRK